MKNHITINQIMEQCEISTKAINVKEQLKFFLQTNEDRQRFIQEYESRLLWRNKNNSYNMMQLAKEIGPYNYTYNNEQELANLGEKEQLERVFMEPVNNAMLGKLKEYDDDINNVIEIKKANPNMRFMEALLYV